MKNEKTNGKKGYYKVNAQKSKDRLISIGNYVAHFPDLDFVLEDTEYKILERIRYENEKHSNEYVPISYTLIEAKTRIGAKTFEKYRDNLISLGFLSIVYQTKEGYKYKVKRTEIREFLERLYTFNNHIDKLRYADKFRVAKGLKALNTSIINKYSGTGFDAPIKDAERYEATPEANTATPEKNPEYSTPEATPKVEKSIQRKEVKPFPQELTYCLYKLNSNEADKRKGNDMYYTQSKVAYLNDFKRHSNEYEPFFDGIFWKATKPNTNNVNLNKN